MLKSYKTEILLTTEQRGKICRSIGICRWLYNEYIARNKRLYHLYQRGCLDGHQKHFLTAMDFDKFVNHHLKNMDELTWINECGSKARKKVITNAETAFQKFFHGKTGFPKFKKKNRQSVSIYFPKNNRGDWTIERHRIQIPTIGKVRLKEFGYLPAGAIVKSGVISQKADRLKLHHRLFSIRTNYTNQVIYAILKREPSFITIEDLNVSGMMKNKHLAKAVAACKFYEFRTKLTAKCHERGIELRIVDRFYPSSKMCHNCGHVKRDLKSKSKQSFLGHCGRTAAVAFCVLCTLDNSGKMSYNKGKQEGVWGK
ncbi:transposase [uncultured Selenomonas sp.]|uniref:RNA-guided endonuclease InsQ/TnpB family protein n=1 Tax=uncultured Selenomonas sp. TaxID=159275 RepID=UPI0025EB5923|nr:transposase [uncultured Selenomonas sp.]